MTQSASFTEILKRVIGEGYKTLKVVITSSEDALVLVRNFGRWFHFAKVNTTDVIKHLRRATSSAFNVAKLIDRMKLRSGRLDAEVGSMVLRYKPSMSCEVSSGRFNRQEFKLGTLTLSGLRLLPESAVAA